MAKLIRFIRHYDVFTSRQCCLAFRAGVTAILLDHQADEAIAAGAAELIADKTPNKRKRNDAGSRSAPSRYVR